MKTQYIQKEFHLFKMLTKISLAGTKLIFQFSGPKRGTTSTEYYLQIQVQLLAHVPTRKNLHVQFTGSQ